MKKVIIEDVFWAFMKKNNDYWKGTHVELYNALSEYEDHLPPTPMALVQWINENMYELMVGGVLVNIGRKYINIGSSAGILKVFGNVDFILEGFLRALRTKFKFHIYEGELHYQVNPATLAKVSDTLFLGMVKSLGPTEYILRSNINELFDALKADVGYEYLLKEQDRYTCPVGLIRCVHLEENYGDHVDCRIADYGPIDVCPMIKKARMYGCVGI